MSLPILGDRSARKAPSREPSHTALDDARLIQIASELDDALADLDATALSPAIVEAISEDLGVRESHVYAAAALMSEIPCDASAATRIEICVGNCQKWGAIELLDRVLEVHGQRAQAGEPGFGVVARACLDRCEGAAVILLHTPDGTAGLRAATLAELDEALEALR